MMTSNIMSRFLPANTTGRSIYEDLRALDETSDVDVEERAGLALDEENLRFHDDELNDADVFNVEDSRLTESTAFLPGQRASQRSAENEGKLKHRSASKFEPQSPRLLEEDGDDDVPASLLIEENTHTRPTGRRSQRNQPQKSNRRQPAIPGPATTQARSQWKAAQAQQRLHPDEPTRNSNAPQPVRRKPTLSSNPREKAMWTWVNVTNLDDFMHQVYGYYLSSGVWCILLEEALGLLRTIFVAFFTTFLTQCIDYKKIPGSSRTAEVLIPQCTKKISGMPNVALWLFALYVIGKLYQCLTDIPRLMRIHDFYLYLLDIPDGDMQTISWQDIVARIMALRDANPITAIAPVAPGLRKYIGTQNKERLDAHDIANRLMRKENYLIALFNKDILDLTLPIPFLRGRQLYSRTLEWTLEYCITDLIFTPAGQVNQMVLKDSYRRQLSDALRSRFLFAGFMTVLLGPIAVIYLVITYFFKYFNEYYKNPAALGSRQYTPLAEWKFREFNELPHLFHERINMSYPFASRYLDQFPKVKMIQFTTFISFIAGAVVSVLTLATVWDPEMFLGFEITPDRTVLFYLGVFGTMWVVAHGAIPDENLVFDPEYALRNVIEYIHYEPLKWHGRLHSDDVKKEFAALYQMKILIFLEEILGFIVTPFILWISLPNCSDQIIDFFREFTIHVDGVGYVCSFAVFDFKKGIVKTAKQGTNNTDMRDEYYSTKHGKMAASYYGFLDNYLLNPKTGVPGHLPPGMRRQFNPPPQFPGLMSPTLPADMQTSRMGASERRPRSRAPTGIGMPPRTPRFPPTGAHGSPMQSILLDPHHQPSSSGFGGPSVRRNSRARYPPRTDIVEESVEDEENDADRRGHESAQSAEPYESGVGLDQSKWELSPLRATGKEREEDGDEDDADPAAAGGGVLGLLDQFLKVQPEGRPGINI
ncbi:autophagy protein Apg9 [Phlyctema vagabunda]|uniref:Autophagy-related protein 9 n=1 Tax=Phlyctema vagabunda TaxID=108571 RepID=A0ABR4PSF6_9HELO